MNELYHHGIKGQRWGVRRFQNEDGSLTPEGMSRYGVDEDGNMSEAGRKQYEKDSKKYRVENYHHAKRANANLSAEEREEAIRKSFDSDEEYEQAKLDYKKHQSQKATAIALGSIGAIALHGAALGIGLGIHNDKKKNAERYYNNQVQSILNNGQDITENILRLKKEEQSLQLAKHRVKTGEIENYSGDMFKDLKNNGGITPKDRGYIDNSGNVYGFNLTQYNPSRLGTKNERTYNVSEAIGQSLRSNKNEQAYQQRRLDEAKDSLKAILEPEVKKQILSDAYKQSKYVKRYNKSMKHTFIVVSPNEELYHHGIKGQKWGIRRFQNEDGSLTPEGMKRYGVDASGNMTKRGAAEYYRDIYNEAKASGYKGQGIHDRVRQHFNSEEEYQNFVKNYKNYKLKKAAVGVGAGLLGAAAVGAGAYGISRGVKTAKENNLVNKYGDKFSTMNMDELIRIHDEGKAGAKTFNTQKMREEAALDSKVAGIIAKRQMKAGEKRWAKNMKTATGTSDEFRNVVAENIAKSQNMSSDTKLQKAYKQHFEKRANIAEKRYLKEVGKEYKTNIRFAAMDQAKVNTGRLAVQNRMNAFSNSYLSQVTTGAGTAAGAMVVNIGLDATRKSIENLVDGATANRLVPKGIKEPKDRSSVLTQPTRADKAWENYNNNPSQQNNYSDDDEDDEEKRKRN